MFARQYYEVEKLQVQYNDLTKRSDISNLRKSKRRVWCKRNTILMDKIEESQQNKENVSVLDAIWRQPKFSLY